MSHISSTKFKKGFTLIELVVSIGIMGVILTTVLTSQSNYTSGSALRQIADDISLSLRQAQVYGISVSQLSGTFDSGYGIEFRMPNAGGDNSSYVLFADGKSPGVQNWVNDSSWSTCDGECLQKTTLTRNNVIKELCYIPLVGHEQDGTPSYPCTIGHAYITFLRPATEAHISLYDNSGSQISINEIKGVRIRLMSPDGGLKSVVVYTTGQISVQDA